MLEHKQSSAREGETSSGIVGPAPHPLQRRHLQSRQGWPQPCGVLPCLFSMGRHQGIIPVHFQREDSMHLFWSLTELCLHAFDYDTQVCFVPLSLKKFKVRIFNFYSCVLKVIYLLRSILNLWEGFWSKREKITELIFLLFILFIALWTLFMFIPI